MEFDGLTTIIGYLLFIGLLFLYPRLMLAQMLMKLEQSAARIESFSSKSRQFIIRKIGRKDVEPKIKLFQNFFSIEPSSLDPFGIVKKIDQITRDVEARFTNFVDEIAGDKPRADRQRINYGLRSAIGVNMLAKIVRHYVEIVRKYKNLQIALVLQMQLPIIEEIAESELRGTEAFINGYPIGDSIGPMVAASMMTKHKVIASDVVYDKTKIYGRDVFILKADGPDPHLGRIDEAITKIIKRKKIAKVITVDAGGKLEGEKTGSVAEGVGFAMGGDVQREIIENILLPRKIPLDSIIVKVGIEEAIMPMKPEISKAVPEVIEAIKAAIKRTKKRGGIIVVGVGNSCGIGNNKESVKEAEKIIRFVDKKMKKKEKKKKKGWF
ncbi:MAG: DUF1512 family protein [Candidatus Aenigmatarchaeota archaeon]